MDSLEGSDDDEEGVGGAVGSLYRSPLITASDWITVFPPSMMCCVPWIMERREILFPVSFFDCFVS